MEQGRNPFEHHHDHDHGSADAEPIDPAQESLADALRVSFFVLKLVMLGSLIAYLFSGVYSVDEQEVAVRLRFGNLVGANAEGQVVWPGGPYLTFPYPIDDVVKIDTTVKSVALEKSFWFDEQTPAQRGPLNPERDSYLLTSDANVLHVQWTVNYRIGGESAGFAERIGQYIRQVGDEAAAENLVQAAAERGIVAFAAQHTADQLIDGLSELERREVRRGIQRALDGLESGLQITSVSGTSIVVPNPVREAFAAVNAAESRRLNDLEKARERRNTVLNEAAGEAHRVIWQLIEEFQERYDRSDEPISPLESPLAAIFENLNTGPAHGNLQVGGEAARMINEALTYRTANRKQIASEADRFESLYEQYRQLPNIVMTRLWEETRQSIFESRVHKIFMRKGRIVIQVNRDPKLQQRYEQEDMELQEAQKAQAN